jgi:hypothetical protein
VEKGADHMGFGRHGHGCWPKSRENENWLEMQHRERGIRPLSRASAMGREGAP